ncbi:MAG: hypothetical protein SGILL_007579, partial [Bacillariaceae sp.]
FWAAGRFSAKAQKEAAAEQKNNAKTRSTKKKKNGMSRSSSMNTARSTESHSTGDSRTKSSNVRMVEAWMMAWQRKEFELVISMSSENCQYLVPIADGETMKVKLTDFLEQMKVTYASFPDYDTEWDEMRDSKDNTVRIKNFVSKGTHTGEPFAFGPYPAMPAKGMKIRDHPVDVLVYIDKQTAKIEKVRLLSKPDVTSGPAMYYLQVGGYIP